MRRDLPLEGGQRLQPVSRVQLVVKELILEFEFIHLRAHPAVFVMRVPQVEVIVEDAIHRAADRLGYLVWGEFPDWGCAGQGPREDHQRPGPSYITEWLEAIERDYSHPSIVGWCPLNETHQLLHDRLTQLDDVTVGIPVSGD